MRVLLVGAGGLGSAASLVLARSGIGPITVLDDDVVDVTNLHRQVLYADDDIGADKVERAVARLRVEGAEVDGIRGRLTPDTALELVRAHDVVVEGADNFATKFLAADACGIAGVPLISAGCVRWSGWALAWTPGAACLRCVFEDLPRDRVETCAEAGVVGPAVGVVGGLQGALTVRLSRGGDPTGELWSYRALDGALRRARVRPRAGCPGCAGDIQDLSRERYAPAACGA